MTYKSTIRYFSKKYQPGRRRPDPKKIEDVMTQSGINNILKKANHLESLNHHLYNTLSAQLSLHCNVMNIEDGVITIGVDDAAWITQLRFQEIDILHTFRRLPGLQGLRVVKYKVMRY